MRLPIRTLADECPGDQSYNMPSPNEMVVDTGDYVGMDDISEKDPVAIINPDDLDQDEDHLQDLPVANDCMWPPPPPRTLASRYTSADATSL